jgi:HK97 gp10 family phage protein
VIRIEAVKPGQVQRAMRKMPAQAKSGVQAVFDDTAQRVVTRAEDRVARRTGLLHASIGWRSRPRSLAAVVGIEGPDAYYWKFIEYGTVKMSARPFMRPAAMAEEQGHRKRVYEALQDASEDMAREANA